MPSADAASPPGGTGHEPGGFRIGVLASGTGTNLQAILDRVHGHGGISVVAVGSDKPGARALERAAAAGIETRVFEHVAFDDREVRDAAMAQWLAERSCDLVVLAGYMQVLSGAFVTRFERRLINVHPSLLPAFAGLDAIGQALEHGVKVTGVTVHFVDHGVDTGPIVLQQAVEVPYTRDADGLESEIHRVEHELLPRAIRLLAAGAVRFDAQNPRLVHVDENR